MRAETPYPSSAVQSGNGVLAIDETHVDDIIALSLGNAIKPTAACDSKHHPNPHLPTSVRGVHSVSSEY